MIYIVITHMEILSRLVSNGKLLVSNIQDLGPCRAAVSFSEGLFPASVQ